MDTKIQNYIDTYEILHQNMKWKVTDKNILMTIASIYTMNNKMLNIEKMLKISDSIKGRAGLFSSMKSYPRFTTAAMLDVNFEDPENQVEQLFDYYERFREAKFSSGTFTYMAATILLTNQDQVKSVEQTINKVKSIYDGMKKEHGFLTSSGDYPLATLLAFEDKEDIIDHIEMYYERLAKNGFRKGNDLQILSHILSLSDDINVEQLVSRAVSVYDSLKTVRIKPKAMYYPAIGILTLLPPEELDIQVIVNMYEKLNQEKQFKWQKDMNVLLAVSFYVNEKLENNGLAETSIYSVLESIIQAQQAVMIAAVTGATAAASSSNN
ncbi:DUF4003 family protein [Ornithinibacillus sp. L9]|uniref:DUF4003 family protein n=1 Tax=Ornithinibacillus caprae TaxID=2678566 RepID=A0A6N8FMK9_9BACI|nr:DUF4003 family protein [Ornithinibacillus caprae]MUK90832.1 DUF4003 family protein [Ornithinibacillus caprae]